MPPERRLPRRAFLGLLGGGAVAAVGAAANRSGLFGDPAPAGAAAEQQYAAAGTRVPTTTATTSSSTTTTTTTAPPPPAFEPYELLAGEVQPEAKRVAADVAQALTTYDPDGGLDAALAVAGDHAAGGFDHGALAAAAAPLGEPGALSRGQVVYPQLGGLDPHAGPTRCSVMVVVAQHLGEPGSESVVQRCLDVRLRREGGAWRFEGLGDVSGAPVGQPAALSDGARRVVEHGGIDLPDSARWDIYEGIVDERVLVELAWLADRVPIAVTTCRRGHPVEVFGTGRTSAHTSGRAVDVWLVGEPVVQQHLDAGSLAHQVSSEIVAAGRVANFGSPWSFGAPGTFTDPVHHDHLHIGF